MVRSKVRAQVGTDEFYDDAEREYLGRVVLARDVRPQMPELTPEELATLLARLDDVMQQAQQMSAEIKSKMAGERRQDHIASDWTDRRQRPERRKKQRV